VRNAASAAARTESVMSVMRLFERTCEMPCGSLVTFHMVVRAKA
jgi:hypothetical protein